MVVAKALMAVICQGLSVRAIHEWAHGVNPFGNLSCLASPVELMPAPSLTKAAVAAFIPIFIRQGKQNHRQRDSWRPMAIRGIMMALSA